MGLLSAQDAQVLQKHLAPIDKPVTLLLFTQTIGGSESGPVARQVLDEIGRLNEKVRVEEKNFVLDVADRERYGVAHSPAIVILSEGADTRMRMIGAPTGYEFVSLVEAVLVAGTGRLELAEQTLQLIASVTTPTRIQVFSTPT
jgi:alkyl hydroperoxide reductase subunit AhpF